MRTRLTKPSYFDQYLPHANRLDYLWVISHPNQLIDHIVSDNSPDELSELEQIADQIIKEITWWTTWQLHGEICDCDDKMCSYLGEIRSWLVDGTYDVRLHTIEELVAEWNEYAGEVIAV